MHIANAIGVCPFRRDTALLAEVALEGRPGRALDLGTGTGYVAVRLALAGATVDAVDVSPRALALARRNARANGADVKVFHSDLFSAVDGRYDVIACNPPQRRRETERSRLITSTLRRSRRLSNAMMSALRPWLEPRRAAFLTTIAEGALERLTPTGRLVLVIGPRETDGLLARVPSLRLSTRRSVADVGGLEVVAFGRSPR